MRTVTFTEFRKHASDMLDLVERGETIRILRHGKPIARILPAEGGDASPGWKRPGLHLVSVGGSLSAAIVEERRTSP